MTVTTISKQGQWQRLLDMILSNQAAWVADIGLKAGLFQRIAQAAPAGIDEETLAESLGFAVRYVRVWCRGAFAFGLLDWDEQKGYRLAAHLDVLLLDPTDPQFMGGRIQFFTALYEDFRAFPTYLSSGAHWPRSEHDPWLIEALKNVTMPDAQVFTGVVLPQAPTSLARLEAGGSLLDIGAGGGFALVHYATRFPTARIVGLEIDGASIKMARQAVADAGLEERIEIRFADANALADEKAFDLVTLSITLHETGGPEEWRNVLWRARRALTPGGTILVSELPYPDSPSAYRTEPIYQLLAGVQLHEAIVGCGMITRNELGELLAGAGFTNIRIAAQPLPTRHIMLAEK